MTTTPYLVHHLLDPREGDADRIALVDGERSVSYQALSDLVSRCAAALRANGLSRGDRVAIVLPKCIEECWAILGTSQASGVFVPVNSVLRAQQIRHIVEDSGARIVICSRALFETTSAALAGLDRLTILCAEEIADGSTDTAAVSAKYDQAIGEDLAAILYTSGSTGKPKGVMLSHRNLLAGSRIVIKYLEITERDRILSILPFSFDYGLNQLLTAIQQRALTVLFTFQLGDEIVRAIRDHAITGLAGVPTIWAILTKTSPLLRKTKLPTLRYITNSGGAVPSETVRRLREMLSDTRIFLMYGLTEAFRSTFLPPEEIDKRPTSIGKAIPECEVFAVKPDGQRAKPGGDDALGVGLIPSLAGGGGKCDLSFDAKPRVSERMTRTFRIEPRNGRNSLCQRSKSHLPLFAALAKAVQRPANIHGNRLRDSHIGASKNTPLRKASKLLRSRLPAPSHSHS